MARTATRTVEIEKTDNKNLLRHTLSALFPSYVGTDKFRELVKSVTHNGVLNPIVLYEGKVLDGWHRYLAALEAGMDVPTVCYTGDESGLLSFVVANNVVRRELSQSQLAMAAARVIRDGDGTGAKPDAKGVQLMFGVGETIVCEANRIIRHGADGLVKLVEGGDLPVKVAAKAAVTLNKSEQERLAAEGPTAVKRAVGNRRLSTPAPHRTPAINGQDETRQLSKSNDLLNQAINALAQVREVVPRLLETAEGKKLTRYIKALSLPWLNDPDVGIGPVHHTWLLLAACTQDRELTLADLKNLFRP